jgi:hypothetical protein
LVKRGRGRPRGSTKKAPAVSFSSPDVVGGDFGGDGGGGAPGADRPRRDSAAKAACMANPKMA